VGKLIVSTSASVRPTEAFVIQLSARAEEFSSWLSVAPFHMQQLQAAMRASPDLHVIVLTLSPVEAVEAGFNNGQTLESALSAWAAEAQAVLSFFKKFRRRVSLINVRDAELVSEWFVEKLTAWAHGGRPEELIPPSPPEGAVAPRAVLIRLVAETIVKRSLEAQKIAAEYSASLIPLLPDVDRTGNLQDADGELRRLEKIEEALGQYAADSEAQHEAMRQVQLGLLECQQSIENYIKENRRLRHLVRRLYAQRKEMARTQASPLVASLTSGARWVTRRFAASL
jgi:hypothetical protein